VQQVIEMRISHQSHGAFQAVEAAIASQWTYGGVLVYLTSCLSRRIPCDAKRVNQAR
jgi:hypothetical protein